MYVLDNIPSAVQKKMVLSCHLSWLEKRHSVASEQADTGFGKAAPGNFSCFAPSDSSKCLKVTELYGQFKKIWREKAFRSPAVQHGAHSIPACTTLCSPLTRSFPLQEGTSLHPCCGTQKPSPPEPNAPTLPLPSSCCLLSPPRGRPQQGCVST